MVLYLHSEAPPRGRCILLAHALYLVSGRKDSIAVAERLCDFQHRPSNPARVTVADLTTVEDLAALCREFGIVVEIATREHESDDQGERMPEKGRAGRRLGYAPVPIRVKPRPERWWFTATLVIGVVAIASGALLWILGKWLGILIGPIAPGGGGP